MKYTDLNSSLESHIMTLRGIIAFMGLMIIFLWYGWNNSKTDIRIHIPPDIRSGAVLKADEISPPNIYTFAGYIFQQLNHWEKNGEKDYGMQIFKTAPYLTPKYREYLINDLDIRGKKGELTGRTRTIQAIPGQGYEERRVDLINENTWVVWLDYHIKESVRGMEIKDVRIRYPVRVIRYNVNPETNPWGLALDGFADKGPQRITDTDVAAEGETEQNEAAGE